MPIVSISLSGKSGSTFSGSLGNWGTRNKDGSIAVTSQLAKVFNFSQHLNGRSCASTIDSLTRDSLPRLVQKFGSKADMSIVPVHGTLKNRTGYAKFEATAGNVGYLLNQLLNWARQNPYATWNVKTISGQSIRPAASYINQNQGQSRTSYTRPQMSKGQTKSKSSGSRSSGGRKTQTSSRSK